MLFLISVNYFKGSNNDPISKVRTFNEMCINSNGTLRNLKVQNWKSYNHESKKKH